MTRPERSGALGAVTLHPQALLLVPLLPPCAQVWPQLSPAAVPSSNYEGSAGALCTRPASEVRPPPPPAEPFTPPFLLVLSRAPLGAPLSHTSPGGPHPPAPSHTNRYSAVPPNRGRRMKIVIKNLSSPRTHCQEAKHRCFHPQCYLVFVPVCTDAAPTLKTKPQKCKANNFFGKL